MFLLRLPLFPLVLPSTKCKLLFVFGRCHSVVIRHVAHLHYSFLYLLLFVSFYFCFQHNRGTGRKLGEGIQFTTTVIGGFIFAFYVSWRVSLLILAVVPLIAVSARFMVTATTKQTERKNKCGDWGDCIFYYFFHPNCLFSQCGRDHD